MSVTEKTIDLIHFVTKPLSERYTLIFLFIWKSGSDIIRFWSASGYSLSSQSFFWHLNTEHQIYRGLSIVLRKPVDRWDSLSSQLIASQGIGCPRTLHTDYPLIVWVSSHWQNPTCKWSPRLHRLTPFITRVCSPDLECWGHWTTKWIYDHLAHPFNQIQCVL